MEEQLLTFLKYLEQEYQYSENTIAAYRNDLGQFLKYVESRGTTADQDWGDISNATIQDYLNYMKHKARPYASSTIARKVAAIKSFFNYLTSQGIVDENPAVDIESPKVKKSLPQTLSADEVQRLLAAPMASTGAKGLRDQALLNVLYYTGMRVTEVVSLQLDDVNFEQEVLLPPGRQGESRVIPMEADTEQLLQTYLTEGRPNLAKSPDELALFLNHRGEKLTRQGLWLIIKGYAKQAGLQTEVTPHTLRHSFASHRLDSGSDLEEIQRLLGHANISTTQVYTQLEPAD